MGKVGWIVAWIVLLCGAGALGVALASAPAQARPPAGAPPVAPEATAVCGPGAWTAKAALPSGVAGNAVAAQSGLLYSFGGMTSSPSSYAAKYDPGANTWTPIASLPGGT